MFRGRWRRTMPSGAVAIVLAATMVHITGAAWAEVPKAPATISQLAWLAGDWVGGAGALTLEERWTTPAGGAMLAVSRTIKADRMVAFEFLRIIERDGGLIYVAQPNGRPPTEFILTRLSGESATFENPAHDFPKMIRYTKQPDGTLEARVSDGGERAETFVFRRPREDR